MVAADLATRGAKRGGVRRIIYVGAGGPVMRRSFALLCTTLAQLRKENCRLFDGLQFGFRGTKLGWRKGNVREMADFADRLGLADLITEEPERVTYRRSIELLLESDGALVLGVDDSGYMPSKLFSYALPGKPLLGIVRRDGPAYAHMRQLSANTLWFDAIQDMPAAGAVNELRLFIEDVAAKRTVDRRTVLEPMLGAAMARRHADLFDACVEADA
jgi:hypothetical protein